MSKRYPQFNHDEAEVHDLIFGIGVKKIADRLGISTQAVYQWRHKGIPKDKLMLLKLLYRKFFAEHQGEFENVVSD